MASSVPDVGEGFRLLGLVPDIALRDDEDDLVARLPEELFVEEDALALLQRLAGVEQEEHRVRPGDVAVGDVRPLEREVVDAWGIDEGDPLAEELGGIADLEVLDLGRRRGRRAGGGPDRVQGRLLAADAEELHLLERERDALAGLVDDRGARLLLVLQVVDDGGGRRDADGQDARAEQRVHEGRLAVVEFADHDEVEAIGLELLHELRAEAGAQGLGAYPIGQLEQIAEGGDYVDALVMKAFQHGGLNLLP